MLTAQNTLSRLGAAIVCAASLAGACRATYAQSLDVSLEPGRSASDSLIPSPAVKPVDYVYVPEEGDPFSVTQSDAYQSDAYQCAPCNTQRYTVGTFAEFLYLQPRDVDVAYALPQDGLLLAGAVPMGHVAMANPGYAAGFRVGAFFATRNDARFTGTWTWYNNNSSSSTAVDDPFLINPLTAFPGTFNAGFPAQAASADYGIDFQFVDFDYEVTALACDSYWIGYVAGVRYGDLQQQFTAVYPFANPDGTTRVDSDIFFNGLGFRLGVQGERLIGRSLGFRLYGRGIASLLAGSFRTSYEQQNQFNGLEVTTGLREDRIVPVMDLELGVAWVGPRGHWRFAAGYMISAWYNTITTPVWIHGVQQTDFTSLEDHLTFDGLVARIESRF